jgi:hypothetical protein
MIVVHIEEISVAEWGGGCSSVNPLEMGGPRWRSMLGDSIPTMAIIPDRRQTAEECSSDKPAFRIHNSLLPRDDLCRAYVCVALYLIHQDGLHAYDCFRPDLLLPLASHAGWEHLEGFTSHGGNSLGSLVEYERRIEFMTGRHPTTSNRR